MSSALAIASVTAVLKNLLENELIQQSATAGVGDVTITALPPDGIPTGAEEHAQLNLHLYRLTPNSGWLRSNVFVSQDGHQQSLPLALDLHYLLTAYAERDLQAEILLGYAIQKLYETPILTQEAIHSALKSIASSSSAESKALSASTLADQLEQIKISPEFLSMEEMSKLWSSLQTRSRLSATYEVSVVLIEDRRVDTAMAGGIPQVVSS
jgi:hypothetical protein